MCPLWHIGSDMTAVWNKAAAHIGAHSGKSTHINIHIKDTHMLIHIHANMHQYIHLLIFCEHCFLLFLCSHLLIHPTFPLLWIQKTTRSPRLRGGTWSEYLVGKKEATEYFIKHLWGTPHIWCWWTLNLKIPLAVNLHPSTIRLSAASSASTIRCWIFKYL